MTSLRLFALPGLMAASLLFAAATPVNAQTQTRTWTSSDGRTLEAEITALEGDQVTLKTAKGEFKLPLARLSPADQTFAKEWQAKKMPPAPGATGGGDDKTVGDFDNLKLGEWPNSVVVDREKLTVETVKEDKDKGEYVYRSPHFEFHANTRLSASVVKEFCEIFEATFEMMKIMPIGLNPKPREGGHYYTKLYDTREAYYAGGGMPGSGGMHTSSWRGREIIKSEIHVPLPNLGVEFTGTRFIVDHQKRSDTLLHEVAHQLTGRWLPITPAWFKEGLAETVSTQRFDNGRFNLTSMDRAIRDDVTKRSGGGREFTMLNLKDLMTITSEQWASDLQSPKGGQLNYPSANVLFYYFARIDSDGKGTNLVNYMKALASGTEEGQARSEVLMKGRTFEQLQEEVAKGWRSNGLQIKFQ